MEYDFRSGKDRSFPPIVHIETTNVCNLKCIHCPQSDPYNLIPGYSPQYIEWDLWTKIVDEIASNNGTLRLTPDGEPMLVSAWTKMVDYALSKNIKTFCFNTHGVFMEGDKMDVLLQDTETQIAIEFSIDGLWKSSYDKIRVGSDYEKLLTNIFSLKKEIRLRKRNNVKILVSCVQQPELEDQEFEHFEKFWTPLVDKVITRRYVDTKGIMPHKPEVDQHREHRWPCLVLFTRLVVTYDGNVRFCPDDWMKTSTIGNVNDNSLQEIWNGKVLSDIREKHLEGKFEDSHIACAGCTDWKVIEWGNDYTAALDNLFS